MRYFFLLLSAFLLVSCSKDEPKQLKIAVNSWIGYAPVFYAYEKGYLKELNIKLIPTVSLGESADIFSVAKVDMLTATQHEVNSLKKSFPSLEPIILIDRSDGGDMILSNRSIQTLKKSKKIYVYLEIDSINKEMIQHFTKYYHLNSKNMIYINKDQSQIQDIQYSDKKDILIVTYIPYDTKLKSIGFKEISSTKNIKSILVVDAICTTLELVQNDKEKFNKFKLLIDKSIKEIDNDPKLSYNLTKKYLNNITFEEYTDSMKSIKWINQPSDALLLELEKIHYLEKNLI